MAAAFVLIAGAAFAEEPEPIPDFAPCLDAEIARFERDLGRARSESYKGLAHFVDGRGVEVCGVGGIVLCDRSAAPLPCQDDLAAEQEALRQEILTTLPAPEGGGLYQKVLALAKGRSAGDDCAGMTPVMAAWCAAREATRRAELAYQVARENGAVEPAFRLGWAEAPAPVRPRARGRP